MEFNELPQFEAGNGSDNDNGCAARLRVAIHQISRSACINIGIRSHAHDVTLIAFLGSVKGSVHWWTDHH